MAVKRPRAADLGLLAAAIVAILPIAWMVLVSFMPRGQAQAFPPPFWPSRWTLANYRELFLQHRFVEGTGVTDYHILPALWNSIAVAVLSTGFGLLFTVPAGYAFAKLRFRGRARLVQLTVALMVVPLQVAMLPLFLLLREAGLVNSYAGVVAPGLAGLYAVLFTRAAAGAIPDELLDAARVDGAGEVAIFLRVVLPLLLPVVVTLGLFAFLNSWGDFLWPLIILSDQNRYTLPVALAAISREHAQDTELMMAGAVLSSVPVLLLFVGLQRFYFSGILGGGVKG
jgi:multiple sugar transport system permease protein